MYISKFPFQVFCCSKHNSRDKMLIKEAPNVGAERESLKSLQGCRQERSAFKICSAELALVHLLLSSKCQYQNFQERRSIFVSTKLTKKIDFYIQFQGRGKSLSLVLYDTKACKSQMVELHVSGVCGKTKCTV